MASVVQLRMALNSPEAAPRVSQSGTRPGWVCCWRERGISLVSDEPRLLITATDPVRWLAEPEGVAFMIVLGVILLIVGFLADISILWTIGIVLVVVGAVLALVGRTGRMVGGRAHWY
jgi:hypothetical protein